MQVDLALVGGGLANSLIAYRLATQRPSLRLALIERGPSLGGNHTWSLHGQDLTPEQYAWLAPFVAYSWPSYEVRFPRFTRHIDSGYSSLTSSQLHRVVIDALGTHALLNTDVQAVSTNEVVLHDGRRLRALTVIDGRGDPLSAHLVLRYQKFLGQVVVLENRHGLDGPILMDATVAQRDGYRFVYTLPYSDKTVLIEDTRYSDSPELDRSALRAEIRRYAERHNWYVKRIEGEEEGILPIVLSGDIHAFWDEAGGVARAGLRAALFHPTTGYSLPEAVRLADDLRGLAITDSAAIYRRVRQRSIAAWKRHRFDRMLNRMLFLAGATHQRYRVLERFYRLPEPLISRFYAGRSTWQDRLRLLAGAPPVPLGQALRAIVASGASSQQRQAGTPRTRGRIS
ncbi:MAG: lycopene beta-cyclase CrtY [Gammaproteobacteria bacterium]